jgi:hypothetical protein
LFNFNEYIPPLIPNQLSTPTVKTKSLRGIVAPSNQIRNPLICSKLTDLILFQTSPNLHQVSEVFNFDSNDVFRTRKLYFYTERLLKYCSDLDEKLYQFYPAEFCKFLVFMMFDPVSRICAFFRIAC